MNLFGWALAAVLAAAQTRPLDVEQIMARVAANQQSARDTRQLYVYHQRQLLSMRRANGKVAREERAEYVVTPAKDGFEKRLDGFTGRYELKGKYVDYDRPGYQYKGLDIDGNLMHDMADDMMNDRKSRDGIGRDMFPLRAEEQKPYEFKLEGIENYRGRRSYRVSFQPDPRLKPDFEEGWKGEARIDAAEFQPAMVETSLAYRIPAAVKLLLGTDIKGLGFSVTYARLAEGVWFPVSYGGELEVRGLFFYKRKISISMLNSDFQKTDVSSSVVYGTEAH